MYHIDLLDERAFRVEELGSDENKEANEVPKGTDIYGRAKNEELEG